MRHKDPELMKKIRTYIGEFYIEHDRTPSTTEIAKYFGIARSTSQNYLVAMNERGLLSYQGGRLVVDKMDKLRTDRQQAPLVGSVPCGELTYEEDRRRSLATVRFISCMPPVIPWRMKGLKTGIWSSSVRILIRRKAIWSLPLMKRTAIH